MEVEPYKEDEDDCKDEVSGHAEIARRRQHLEGLAQGRRRSGQRILVVKTGEASLRCRTRRQIRHNVLSFCS
jgi:hypothetical protein